jgi:hypothetical protein
VVAAVERLLTVVKGPTAFAGLVVNSAVVGNVHCVTVTPLIMVVVVVKNRYETFVALNANAPPITAKRAMPDKINLAFVMGIVAFVNQKAKLK